MIYLWVHTCILQSFERSFPGPWNLQHTQIFEFEEKKEPVPSEQRRRGAATLKEEPAISVEIAGGEEGETDKWKIIPLTALQVCSTTFTDKLRTLVSLLFLLSMEIILNDFCNRFSRGMLTSGEKLLTVFHRRARFPFTGQAKTLL